MLTRRSVLAGFAALGYMAVAPAGAMAEDDRPLVITDARGDYGLLAPYAHMIRGPGYLYTSYVFDALLDQDTDGAIVPGLAQSWQVSDDLTQYDLTLNPAAKWHDGTPVTAGDALFTINTMKEHRHPFVSLGLVATAEAPDDHHVRITLSRPDAGFVRNVLVTMMILPHHIYEGQADPTRFAEPVAATGSGPYRLAQYDKAQGRYFLERNPDYYRGTPRFSQIVIVRMTPEAALQGMRAGDVDVMSDLPHDLVPQAQEMGMGVLTTSSGHPERLVFNHRGLFSDRGLRHAMAHMVDRDALVAIAARGAATAAAPGYFQPGSPWRSDRAPVGYAHDTARAAELLTQAGWVPGADGRWRVDGEPVELRLVTDGRHRRVATVVAEQIETFGIPVDFRVMERAALQQVVQDGDFDLMVLSGSTIGDPGAILNRVFGHSWSSDRYPDPSGEMRALIEAQAALRDMAERRALLHRFETFYATELPSLMLINAIWGVAHNDRVAPVYLPDGIASGIPMALPRSIFLR